MNESKDKRPCADEPSLAGETVEPRILLSATWITVTLGNDALVGTAGDDRIAGSAFDDTLWGLAGDDLLKGGWGSDTLDGGAGTDTADFSDAYGAVTVDITQSGPQNTGGAGTDTLIGIEGVAGGIYGDTFAFANPTDGAVYHVSGGLGADTIDLSRFASSAMTFGDGTITVDMGAGQSFRIDHDGVEAFHFGDVDAIVLTGDQTKSSFAGSAIYVDGAQAFRVEARGGGDIDWTYNAASDTFAITDTGGTGFATQVRITDLDGNDLAVSSITIDRDLGSFASNVDVGSIVITSDHKTIADIDIAGGTGVLGSFTSTGSINRPTTIHAQIGSIALSGNLEAALFVDGDLGSLNLAMIRSSGSIQVSGDLGTITVGDVDGDVRVGGHVGSLSAADLDADITIDGDLDAASFTTVSSSSHVSVSNVVGTLDFRVGGVQHGGTFASPTTWTFDGATQTASIVSANVAPIGHAGADQVVTEGDLVTLNATASSDANGDPLSYQWVQVGGPAVTLSDPTAAQPTFVAPEGLVDTDLKFAVTVGDGTTVSAVDTVTITVNAADDAPSADAGPDQLTDTGAVVTLDAAASSDPEGLGLAYRWVQTGGPIVTLSDPNAAQPAFTAPNVLDPTRLTFTVEVSDGTSVSSDTVVVTVNPPGLVANWSFEGAGQTVVDATGHGNDGRLGTTIGSDSRDPTRVVDATHGNVLQFDGDDVVSGLGMGPDGAFSISAWAQYDGSGTGWQTIYSSGDCETWLGVYAASGRVALSVGGPFDWFETAPGTITSGGWHHIAGTWDGTTAHIYVDGVDLPLTVVGTPHAPVAAAGAIGALAANPAQYGWHGALDDVRVYDLAIDATTVAGTMGNEVPIASAGGDQTVGEGDVVTLDGTASADPEGLALTYTWVQTSGPAVTLGDPNAAQPTFTAPEGVSNTDLEFQLQVGDGVRISVADTVRVTVNADDDAPNADAGPDRLVEANDVVALDGLGSSDPEGQGLTYTWVQTSGPAVTLSDPNAPQPTFNAPDIGANTTITFDLTVSDGTNVSSVDSVTVRVGTWLEGTAGDDALVGTTGDDRLRTFGGDDTLRGGAGDDVLDGGAGRDLADYSGSNAAVTVDVTLAGAQDTGGEGVDTLVGIEGAIGSAFDDVFLFSNPVAGSVYTIDGGGGTNTIDLSGFASSAITFGDGTLTVDIGGGQSFAIEYRNVRIIEFGDVTARTMTGSMNAANYYGASIWIDGPQAFRIDETGAGSIDWSYDVATDTFRVTAANGTDATTSIAITDLNGSDLVVDQITLGDGIGSLTSSVDIGTITITASHETIGTITIAGGTGSLGAFVTTTGTLDDPTTIQADVGAISVAQDIAASFTVVGDVGSISARDVSGAVHVTGGVGSLTARYTDAAVQIDGALGTLAVDELRFAATVGGDVASVTANEIRADLTIAGDLDTAAIASVDPAATVTVQHALGTLDFRVGGTQHGSTFAVPTAFTFVGATQSAITNVAGNTVPVANAGPDQSVGEGAVVTLSAAGSVDPDGDPLTYTWTQVAGPPVALSDPHAAAPTFTAPELLAGTTVQFRLTVADGNGPVGTDTVTITIAADDDAPSVDAGADRAVRGGTEVQLSAAGTDPEGQGLSYQWTQLSGPAVTLSDATSREPTFTAPDAPAEGAVVVFAVGASDGQTTAWDTVRIAIAANTAPEVLLQATPTNTPGSLVTMRAIAQDADGDPLTYRWTQLSGPAVQLQANDQPVLRFAAPTVATATDVTFQVDVSDGHATTTRVVATTIAPAQAPAPTTTTTTTTTTSTTAAADAAAADDTATTDTDPPTTAGATAAPLPYIAPPTTAASSGAGTGNGGEEPGSSYAALANATLASPTSSTPSTGSPTSSFGADTPSTESGGSDRNDRYLLQNLLDDDDDADAAGRGARAELPDLVVGDAGAEIDLAPRLAADGSADPIENVRWTQVAGTRIDLDTVEGSVLRIRLPEVFVEEELVFSVELFRGGERVVQEVTVQVQPVALTTRALSIDEPGPAQRDDSAAPGDDASGPGVGRIWGALAAFFGAQSGRRRRG